MAWSRNTDWTVYYKIPDNLQQEYLKRLELEEKTTSREYLDELIVANQIKIPFENLDVTDFRKPISIEPVKLLDKIILGRRGGYCFELNGLFAMLLVSLGFNAWMCPCRQLRHSEPVPVPATHCSVLVHSDGKILFCDVGYGGPVPAGSIELTPEQCQTVKNETFYFHQSGIIPSLAEQANVKSGWYTLIRKSSENAAIEIPLMQVVPIHFFLADFYGQSLLRSAGDTAYSLRHVARRTPNGYIDLTGDVLTMVENQKKIEHSILEEEMEKVLSQYFGIELNMDMCLKE